jgi:hypothetical protein
MMLDGVLVLEVGSHNFSWHGTHVDSMLYFSRCYIPNPAGISYPSMPDIKVKEEGVKQLLQKKNPKKACGSD